MPQVAPPTTPHTGADGEPLRVLLASPRGFCAGVERAIRIVEEALEQCGAPVYVRHEIVHNVHVIARLKAKGAVFIDDIDDAPDDRPLILSAHGSARTIHENAERRGLRLVDATCPLVLKVHNRARRLTERGYHIILIGHHGHQEVTGTLGQVPANKMSLVANVIDVESLDLPEDARGGPIAYVTQTTLSVDETSAIIEALKARFPDIHGPDAADICYATSNRQDAIRAIAPQSDLVIVIGSQSSSNSRRMVEVARDHGAKKAILIDGPDGFDWSCLEGVANLGLSSGASVPEDLVEGFLEALAGRRTFSIEPVEVASETISFKMPPSLKAAV